MFSIVLCSHNGTPTLPRTLGALCEVGFPADGAEILLVDNASTDGTFELFPEIIAGLPTQRLREPRRGKSFALNTAISVATGDYIAFMDDDVRPEPDWLLAYAEAVQLHPEATVFCGQVRPDFEDEAPRWLCHLCAIGESFGTTPEQLNKRIQSVPFSQAKGANLLVRRNALGRVMFDEGSFNYSGSSPGGEDTLIVKHLTENGSPVLFVPKACVRHWIPRGEMVMDKVVTRYRRIGRSMEQRSHLEKRPAKEATAHKLGKYRRKLAWQKVRSAVARITGNARRRSELQVKMAKLTGQIDYLESLRSSDHRRRPR